MVVNWYTQKGWAEIGEGLVPSAAATLPRNSVGTVVHAVVPAGLHRLRPTLLNVGMRRFRSTNSWRICFYYTLGRSGRVLF